MKLIGGFSKYHGVCGNNNKVSFVTNLLVLHVTNAGKFRLNMNFVLSFIEEETNKLLRRSNMLPFSISTLANTQYLWNSRRHFLNRAREDSRRYVVTVAFFALTKENWRYLKYNCYPQPKRVWYHSFTKNKKSVHLNSRMAFITLAMLEHMPLTCYVLPQGKAFNVRR